ncbi:MAG: enoyl-CoA hydratase/isomerase family protein [Deltaproteobacteria bacterium]|nr:enoyl-CoA hydratase/isomerase family protein [Deltaproteobacteria bacterium]
MEFKNLLVENNQGIVTLKINRPQAMNALNPEVLSELAVFAHEVNKKDEIKAVIITGAGEKAFVAGADIAAMKDMTTLQAKAFCDLGHCVMKQIETAHKPIVAAVNGFCLGGGLELALSCDFIYASENAKLGLPEVNLGIFPGFGGTQRLPRLIGKNRAKEMIFTARMLSAAEAYEWGIINKVTPAADLMSAVQATVQEMIKKGPLAIQLAKQSINQGSDLDINSGLAIEKAIFPTVFSTEDKKEGITAFLEKRKAEFKGK